MINFLQNSGLCGGVRNAYNKALQQAEKIKNGETVYLYGNLANNSHIMENLTSRGFITAYNIDDITPHSTAIIRSHGVPEAVYAQLAEKNVFIVDCTCVMVKNIHNVVKEKTEAGGTVLIVGEEGHPEVVGTHGWCKNGHGIIVHSAEDINNLGQINKPLTVVGQTTCSKTLWDTAVDLILKKFPHAQIHDTLCGVVAERVVKAAEIAKNCETMIIAGDKDSANSLKLVESCKAVCSDVKFISRIEDISASFEFTGNNKHIGLAGSASTPDDLLEEIHSHLLFLEFLHRVKTDVYQASEHLFDKLIKESSGKPFVEDAIKDLCHQNKDGKAIRAAMIKLGEIIAGGSGSVCLPVALSYELFQTSILIHDDIIDNSPMRRGKATIHSLSGDSSLGVSRAICIGDMGLFLANKIIAEADLPSDILIKIMRLFSQIQLTTLEGEIMDVCLPYEPINIKTHYEKYTSIVGSIYEYKTAWYTLAGPMMLGAICGGGSEGTLETIKNFALPLGLAFQIKDDILGIFSSDKVLGKSNLSDIAEKKQTLLYGYAAKNAAEQDYALLQNSYGKKGANKSDLKAVRDIFIKTGALKHAEDEINRLSNISLEAIERMDTKHKPLLRGLVSYLINRLF